jgi:hypothetical protein
MLFIISSLTSKVFNSISSLKWPQNDDQQKRVKQFQQQSQHRQDEVQQEQHGGQHVVLAPVPANVVIGQDHLQRGQPRRQEAVRRPLIQLQQVGEAGRQHDRPFDSSNQAQALSAHRCGKSLNCKTNKLLRINHQPLT